MELAAGEQVLVLGPSGSGKSTLLGLWAGLLSPTGGTVTLGETQIHTLRGRSLDRWRGREVGIVYQEARLIATQTVRANVALPLRLAGLGKTGSDAAVDDTLRGLGIAHLAGRLPGDCSVGERQRAGIARALVTSPTLLLADEPTSALDRANALAVADLLRERAAALGAILAVVTHDERLGPYFSRTIEL